jgi:riboflavin kinase/FMN adenylyltransferase
MDIIRTTSDVPVAELAGVRVVLAIGVFDGVHAGHRFLFADVLDFAASAHALVAAYTFWPYPSHFYAKNPKKIIVSPGCKFELLASLGVQYAVEQRFDAGFAALSPGGFVELLSEKFDSLVAVCVGTDFKFGNGRSGDVAKLMELCGEIGVAVRIVNEFCVDGERVSSSKIRALIERHDFSAANRLLGDEIF